jgi:phosphate transport system substrate-binding protein
MPLSENEIKKKIVLSLLDFSTHTDLYSDQEVSPSSKKEMLAIALEVNKLIKNLSLPNNEMELYKQGNYIKPRNKNYLRVKRAAELVFFYKADLNVISMDLGVSISEASELSDVAIEYISDNLPLNDFTKILISDKSIKPKQAEIRSQTASQKLLPPQSKSIGCMAPILFLVLLGSIGYMVYDRFFMNNATQLTSLMNEYRSDNRQLASLSVASKSKDIVVKGSGALIQVFEDYKNGFRIDNPGLNLNLQVTDSTVAINDLIDGKIDVASCSRIPTVAERKKAVKFSNKELVDHKIAFDVVVVIVNKANPIEILSVEDLQKIYSNEAIRWKDFQGLDVPIKKYSKTFEHGTVSFFKERVLYGAPFSNDVTQIYDIKQILDLVENDPNAISFASLSDVKNRNVKILNIATVFDDRGVSPVTIDVNGNVSIAVDMVKQGQYPLSRYLYLVTAGKLTTNVAKFIDYMRSGSVQSKLDQYSLVSIYD